MHFSFSWLLWIDAHWQALLGWLTGLITLVKVGRYFAKMAVSINRVFERFAEAEQTLHSLASNHLPHIQMEMEKVNEGIADLKITTDGSNELLAGVREDIRAVLDKL